MLTRALRLLLARSWQPFRFTGRRGEPLDLDVPRLGLYVHVPFCRTICDFCPYSKQPLDRPLLEEYGEALLAEIDLVAGQGPPRPATSLYYGGGTPALALAWLPRINAALDRHFHRTGHAGIELHPADVDGPMLRELRSCGFDMVSLGIQSFRADSLQALGRRPLDGVEVLSRAQAAGFTAIDVDLIFCLPGQREADLLDDLETAVRHGATQVSTYPFINFSYTNQRRRAQGRLEKRRMLRALARRADELGFARTSVWTFARRGTPRYSSVTRESFVGFGSSAASLLKNRFKINTFSTKDYIRSVAAGVIPTALVLDFDLRARAAYWLFWSCYGLEIDEAAFRELFGVELHRVFGNELALARRLGILQAVPGGYRLTERGAYWFHLVEQEYTHQYIDKTWRLGMTDPWPATLALD